MLGRVTERAVLRLQPMPPNMPAHKTIFATLRKPPPPYSAEDERYKYFASWHAAPNDQNELMAFETTRCARGSSAARSTLCTLHRSLHPSARRARKLLENDFFQRCQAKGLLPAASHKKWNLGSLAFFVLFTQARLTIKQAVGGSATYGNVKDDSGVGSELERICDWLMNPVACATTWQPLLTIRAQNPHYGTQHPPATS